MAGWGGIDKIFKIKDLTFKILMVYDWHHFNLTSTFHSRKKFPKKRR